MKPKFTIATNTFFFFFLFSVTTVFSQKNNPNNCFPIIDSDSLKGFDEDAAIKSAISERFLGDELKIKMYRLKRDYINNKFGLVRTPAFNYFENNSAAYRPAATPGCSNEDFEASPTVTAITSSNQIAGWTIVAGYNGPLANPPANSYSLYFPNGLLLPTSCNLDGCCPMPPSASAIVDCSSGVIDPGIGPQYPIFSVFGTGTVSGSGAVNPQITTGMSGTKVLRLNNNTNGDYSIEKLSKTFSVTPANAFFRYAFISVVAAAHPCCDAGALKIRVLNTSVNPPSLIPCVSFSATPSSSQCVSTATLNYLEIYTALPYNPNTSFGNVYNPWEIKYLDLSPYIGQTITLELIVSDCTAGGHFSYAYFDAQCGPMQVKVDQTDFSLPDPISYSVCATEATITAPAGFPAYQWSGPSGFTSTNSAINVTTSGIYTLNFGQGLLCTPVSKTIEISLVSSTGTATTSGDIICNGNSAILTALAMQNCVWNTGDQTPTIYVSPTVTTTYTVTGTSIEGCSVTAVITQSVDECAGINSQAIGQNEAMVYPNPNSGEFILNVGMGIRKGELVVDNAQGQLVYKQAITNGKNPIRIKGLANGVYYYTILENKHSVSKGKFKVE